VVATNVLHHTTLAPAGTPLCDVRG